MLTAVRRFLALALLSACAPIRFSVQEVLLRHDPSADTLDVLILYDGVQVAPQNEDKDEMAVAQRFVTRVTVGGRELMLVDWPFHFDLDDIQKDASDDVHDEKDPWTSWQREGLECLGTIRVVSSGFYAGDQGRPSAHQRFRIEKASRLIGLIDRSLPIWIDEYVHAGSLEKELPFLDAKSRDAWVELAKHRTRWFALRDGAIEIDLPMTSESAVKLLATVFEEGADDPISARIIASLTVPLSELHIAEGRLRIALHPKGGVIRLRIESSGEFDGRLSEKLRSSEEFPKHLSSREEVIRAFGDH